jgi:hypothetical protein
MFGMRYARFNSVREESRLLNIDYEIMRFEWLGRRCKHQFAPLIEQQYVRLLGRSCARPHVDFIMEFCIKAGRPVALEPTALPQERGVFVWCVSSSRRALVCSISRAPPADPRCLLSRVHPPHPTEGPSAVEEHLHFVHLSVALVCSHSANKTFNPILANISSLNATTFVMHFGLQLAHST